MDNEILKWFGERVRAKRIEVGLSQEQLGQKTGLDRTYISGIERGLRNIGLINVHKIAAALDVSAASLMAGTFHG